MWRNRDDEGLAPEAPEGNLSISLKTIRFLHLLFCVKTLQKQNLCVTEKIHTDLLGLKIQL